MIWFMHDNHTFKRLDTMSVDQAMDYCERVSEEEGCGFVGVKIDGQRDQIVQWHRGKPWRESVRSLLTTVTVSAEVKP